MTDIHRRTPVDVLREELNETRKILLEHMEDVANLRKEIQQVNNDNQSLDRINANLSQLSIAALAQLGVLRVELTPDMEVIAHRVEVGETNDEPPPRYVPGTVSTRHGDGGPIAWVFIPPAPYNDVEIVCSPDGGTPIGMKCWATRKLVGGERAKFNITWEKME